MIYVLFRGQPQGFYDVMIKEHILLTAQPSKHKSQFSSPATGIKSSIHPERIKLRDAKRDGHFKPSQVGNGKKQVGKSSKSSSKNGEIFQTFGILAKNWVIFLEKRILPPKD